MSEVPLYPTLVLNPPHPHTTAMLNLPRVQPREGQKLALRGLAWDRPAAGALEATQGREAPFKDVLFMAPPPTLTPHCRTPPFASPIHARARSLLTPLPKTTPADQPASLPACLHHTSHRILPHPRPLPPIRQLDPPTTEHCGQFGQFNFHRPDEVLLPIPWFADLEVHAELTQH